jgi:CDP-diglyceride synthetase
VVVRCRQCGYEGPAEPQSPGKTWLEAVFWIAFLVPGLIYSLWRLFGRRYLCPRCKAADGQVTVPLGRRVAVGLRAVLLLMFVAAVALLALVWNYPTPGP